MKFLYVYTYVPPDNEWRIFEALKMGTIGVGEYEEALMLVVDDHNAMHLVRERHYHNRNSGSFYVTPDELDYMIADIEADWEKRHCWRLAYDDAQRLKARL